MENIAHTLAGFALARAGLGRRAPLATTVLVLGSNLPDLDGAAFLRGRLAYIDCHRGPTHSVVGGAVMALAFGAIVYALDRFAISRLRPAAARARFLPLAALALAALVLHLGFDLLNDYGIRLALPFSDRWYYGDVIFIVDPWFWLILGGGLHLTAKLRPVGEGLAWVGWGALTLPMLFAPAVPMPAGGIWLLALLALGVARIGATRAGAATRSVPPPPVPVSKSNGSLLPGESSHDAGGEALEAAKEITAYGRPAAGRTSFPRPGRLVGSEDRRALWARAALATLAVYCLLVLTLRSYALARARRAVEDLESRADVRRLTLLPRPADPFDWSVVYERAGEIVTGSVSVLKPASPESLQSQVFKKNLDDPVTLAALGTVSGRTARRFCRYLFADLHEGEAGTSVAFRDARFAIRDTRDFSVFVVPPEPRKPGADQ